MKSALLFIIACLLPLSSLAADRDFNGTWTIDFRTSTERKRGAECGGASFTLVQKGQLITGEHSFATVGCGRLNEGGPESVKGVVVGNAAILVVTSGRNGAIVMGKATRMKNRLRWETLQDVKAGEFKGDLDLILPKGILVREN